MIKKEYQKPAMQVVRILQHSIICTSPGVQSLDNPDGFNFDPNVPLTGDDV